ncbi:MAG: hypothetical protein ACTSQ8_19210 [Candidatus Helarchaeota archaeon]
MDGKKISKKTQKKHGHVKRGTGKSGTETLENEDERERLENEYIDLDLKESIINQATAEKAFYSMKEWDGLDNLIEASSLESIKKFIKELRKKWQKINIDEIKKEQITLKTGMRRSGRYIETDKYVIPINILGIEYFQLRERKTGRFIGTFRADKYE